MDVDKLKQIIRELIANIIRYHNREWVDIKDYFKPLCDDTHPTVIHFKGLSAEEAAQPANKTMFKNQLPNLKRDLIPNCHRFGLPGNDGNNVDELRERLYRHYKDNQAKYLAQMDSWGQLDRELASLAENLQRVTQLTELLNLLSYLGTLQPGDSIPRPPRRDDDDDNAGAMQQLNINE